jgi:3-isopropylmalate/(R)-2-methylmalate dehydratase small subunit
MDDIDTDMIFHNKYLAITEIARMGEHTFETLDGYGDFAASARPGDIVIAGGNFGCGSSRQAAVDCFIPLGVKLVITASTGAIYKRNIINSGFPFLEVSGLHEAGIEEGMELEIDFEKGTLTLPGGKVIEADRPTSVQLEICRAGGLFAYTGEED